MQNKSIFTLKNFLIFALVVIIIWLTPPCNSKPVEKPVVISANKIIDTLNLLDEQVKAMNDSFALIINKAYEDNDKNYTNYIHQLNINSELLRNNKILSMPIPDTCKPLMMAWIERERQIKVASDNKDAAAKTTITGLQGTLWEQQRFLTAKDTAYNKLKRVADTCASAYKQIEKYAKKISPKREIILGLSGITPYDEIKPSIGLVLGYKGKNGMELRAGYYTNKNVTVTLSKPLFRF